MDEGMIAAVPASRFHWSLRSQVDRLRQWAVGLLVRLAVRLVGETNSIRHARMELRHALAEPKDSPDRWMADALLQLLAIFSAQGHSGFSASWCVDTFTLLARFQPLGPLTGADDEWFDHGDGMMQNKRCGHVFKQPDRFNGQAYDIDGRIFREPNGCTYTNGKSHVPITFPYTPKREYVDVPAAE
jgi:hypothetical protein